MLPASAGPRPPVVGMPCSAQIRADKPSHFSPPACPTHAPSQPRYGQAVPPNLNVRQLCPNCRKDPPNIIEEYSRGDLVCGDCGTILGDRIVDTRSEWRTFAGDEGGDDPSRVGDAGNALLGNLLETSISSQDGRTGMARDLQRAQARVASQQNGTTSTASLQATFAKIAEKCDMMNLPRNVVTRAQHIYKIADEHVHVRGPKNERSFIAAAITLAGRGLGAERTFAEVCKATGVGKKALFHAINDAKDALKLSSATKPGEIVGLSSTEKSAEGLLTRFINYLDLDNTINKASKHIVAQATAKAKIDGRNPHSIAAGVLYFTCVLFERKTTAKDIAEVAGITDGTIKLICKLVSEKLDEVIKPEWKTEHAKGYSDLASMSTGFDFSSLHPSTANTPRSGTPVPENGRRGKANSKSKSPIPPSANGESRPSTPVNGPNDTASPNGQ